MADLKSCPVCGAKAFLSRDVIDGVFFMGWSVGCPRYCLFDGIHGVNSFDADENEHYSCFGFTTKEEAIEWWNRRCTPSEIEITPFEVGDTVHIPLPKDKKIMTYNGVEIDFDYEAED